MKRIVLTLVFLTAASVLVLAGATAALGAAQDDLVIDRTVLAGDPAAAHGIALTAWLSGRERTEFWKSTLDLGEGTHETEFSHHIFALDIPRSPFADAEIRTAGTNFGSYGRHETSDAQRLDLMLRPALDIGERTAAGEKRTETVSLADYYDYYPMELSVRMLTEDGTNFFYSSEDAEDRAFTRAFQIPVPEDHLVEVSVLKDLSGNITEVHSSDVGGWTGWYWQGAVDLRGVYVYLPLAEISEMDGAADGIWFIPLSMADENGIPEMSVDMEKKRIFYPVTIAQNQVLGVELRGEDQLLLFTRENDVLVLTVLSRADGRVLQRIETVSCAAEEPWRQCHQGEDFLFLFCGGDFMVLEERDGLYAPALREIYEYPERLLPGWRDMGEEDILWDGERLVIAHSGGGTDRSHLGLELLVEVYGEEGLLYAGHYENSVGQDASAVASRAYYRDSEEGNALCLRLAKE